MVRIITNETPTEELHRLLIEERKDLCKKAAKEFGCPVEEIMFNINNAGIYTFRQMTPDEAIRLAAQEQTQKRTIAIKKSRGVFNE